MKSFTFNLLPQKARSLVKKEEKRDNYSVMVTVLPLMGVIIWLILILLNGLVVENYRQSWEKIVADRNNTINYDLVPIMMKHGELVVKTNGLEDVITKDIKPEQLFVLLDEIYSNQDLSFKIIGYGRKDDGSFQVSIVATDFLRISELTRRFATYRYINGVKIDTAVYDEKANNVNAVISFYFNYEQSESSQ
jgi:hypothetical protein